MASERDPHCCYSYTWSQDYRERNQPTDCPGVLATKLAKGDPEDGYYIQICPRAAWLGNLATAVSFCGLGPDVIILHRNSIPTAEECEQAVRRIDEEW